jgi:hypothetical protein
MPIVTKNLELFFQHAPVADLASLAAVSTVGMVNGLIIEVSSVGFFELQTPAIATPDGRDIIAGTGGGVWLRQTLPVLTTTTSGQIAISKLQVAQTPILLTINTSMDGTTLSVGTPYIYQCTSATPITLTLVAGCTFRNPTVLYGSSSTMGFNPEDVFTLTRYADNTILIS